MLNRHLTTIGQMHAERPKRLRMAKIPNLVNRHAAKLKGRARKSKRAREKECRAINAC